MDETFRYQIEGGPSNEEIWDAGKYRYHEPTLGLVQFGLRVSQPKGWTFCGPITVPTRLWQLDKVEWAKDEDAAGWVIISGTCIARSPIDGREHEYKFENARYNAALGSGSIELRMS